MNLQYKAFFAPFAPRKTMKLWVDQIDVEGASKPLEEMSYDELCEVLQDKEFSYFDVDGDLDEEISIADDTIGKAKGKSLATFFVQLRKLPTDKNLFGSISDFVKADPLLAADWKRLFPKRPSGEERREFCRVARRAYMDTIHAIIKHLEEATEELSVESSEDLICRVVEGIAEAEEGFNLDEDEVEILDLLAYWESLDLVSELSADVCDSIEGVIKASNSSFERALIDLFEKVHQQDLECRQALAKPEPPLMSLAPELLCELTDLAVAFAADFQSEHKKDFVKKLTDFLGRYDAEMASRNRVEISSLAKSVVDDRMGWSEVERRIVESINEQPLMKSAEANPMSRQEAYFMERASSDLKEWWMDCRSSQYKLLLSAKQHIESLLKENIASLKAAYELTMQGESLIEPKTYLSAMKAGVKLPKSDWDYLWGFFQEFKRVYEKAESDLDKITALEECAFKLAHSRCRLDFQEQILAFLVRRIQGSISIFTHLMIVRDIALDHRKLEDFKERLVSEGFGVEGLV